MVWMFVWLGIALGAAAVVFLFASVVARSESGEGDEQGLGAFWRDFRSGLLRRRARRTGDGLTVGTVRMPQPVDSTIDEFFTATQVTSRAYVDAEELTDVLHKARERATRPLHGHGERGRAATPPTGAAAPPTGAPRRPQARGRPPARDRRTAHRGRRRDGPPRV